MSRKIRFLSAVVASLVLAIVAQRPAAGDPPSYLAAAQYREAVERFEQQVLRTPKIRRSVERLVDDLETSSIRLMSAAHDPARFDRLYSRFIANDKLHSRVGLTFFGDPLFPAGPELETCWIAVAETYADLTYEIQYLQRLRNLKRGKFAPIIDHAYQVGPYPTLNPISGSPYPGLPQVQGNVQGNFGPDLAEYPPQVGTSLADPRSERVFSISPPRPGLGEEEIRRQEAAVETRRTITTKEELRSAVLDALRQR